MPWLRPVWKKDFTQKITELQEKRPSLVRDIFSEMIKDRLVVFALIYLGCFFAMGIVGPFFAPYGYDFIDYEHVREGPTALHWFGTDLIGRDIFTRILYSARTTILLSVVVAVFGGILVGTILGLVSGYFAGRDFRKGGWIDSFIMRLGEVLSSVPSFFMFLFLTVTLRPRYEEFLYSLGAAGTWFINEGIVDFAMIFTVFSLFYWVGGARIIRAQTLSIKSLPYVDAARILGAPLKRIIFYHILPNVSGILILWTFSVLGSVALLEVGLSFLGLGIRPPHPSFGVMFSEISSVRLLGTYPHLLIFPAVFVCLYIFAFLRLEMELNRITQSLYMQAGKSKN